MPYHPVVRMDEPGKVQAVFDYAAMQQGVSFRSPALRGPSIAERLLSSLHPLKAEEGRDDSGNQGIVLPGESG